MSVSDDEESRPFVLSEHARIVIDERQISADWVARTLTNPERTDLHVNDPDLRHAFARIPDYGNRVLHVVYNHTTDPPKIVTAYFDRSMRDQR